MNDLKKNYENACNAYLEAFCEKHEFDYESAYWIGGDAGGIVDVCDYCIGMDTIRADIDLIAADHEFAEWYDYCLRLGMIDEEIPRPNFECWIRGCPRKREDEIRELERMRERVEKAKAALMDAIKSEKQLRQ